jgi:methionyl-tRNA formyltransferase
LRLVFFGSGTFALATFEALVAAGRAPVLVVTRPPRRRRRGGAEEPTPVHVAARAKGIEVHVPDRVNGAESLERLRAMQADLFVVAEYGQILGRALLDIPPKGTLNVHGSLLPRWRGATPVEAALLAGDAETGVTIQRTVFELDAGPVLARRRVAIAPDDDAGTLRDRLAALGAGLLVEVVEAIAADRPPREEPQEAAAATYCKRLAPEDGVIDWRAEARRIERQVRAFRPKPGARATLLRDPPLPVTLRRAAAVDGAAEPGVVAAVGPSSFDVGTGEGLLRVLELVPASRKPMDARAFVNGYRLRPGERFA